MQGRIERAKELLLVTDHSIASLAHALGYSDVCSFSITFKRVIGVRPAVFRQQHLARPERRAPAD